MTQVNRQWAAGGSVSGTTVRSILATLIVWLALLPPGPFAAMTGRGFAYRRSSLANSIISDSLRSETAQWLIPPRIQ